MGSSHNLPLRETALVEGDAKVAGEERNAWAEIRHVIFYYLAEHYRQAGPGVGLKRPPWAAPLAVSW